MKKLITIGMAMCCFLTITGFTIAEVREYFQVAQNRVTKTIREEIPLDVEIDRLELLLTKTDRQVSRQKYQVAKSEVLMEEADTILLSQQNDCETILDSMRTLRKVQKQGGNNLQVGCHRVSSDEIAQALAYKLNAYQLKTSSWEARKRAVEQQRAAYNKLYTGYTEWNQKRQLLSHRLETLRSRLAANQAGNTQSGQTFQTTDLARATELADEIEQKLKIAETQQALGTAPFEGLIQERSAGTRDVTAEVDQLLETTQSSSIK